MRDILLIDYEFPPFPGSESLRALKTVKYLVKFGWSPLVLTAKHPRNMNDDSLASQLPKDILIHRTRSLNSKASNLAIAFLETIVGKLGSQIEKDEGGQIQKRRNSQVIGRFLSTFLAWTFLTEYKIGWLLPAISTGKRILKRHKIEAIISKSCPIASHLVALKLKSDFDIPWIADFSDPWTQNPYHRYVRYGNRLARKFEERFESKVANTADRIIFTTEQTRLQFLAKYKNILPSKVITIPNAYDPQEFAPPKQTVKSSEFVITHVGGLGGLRSAEPIFKALKLLKTNDMKLKVRMIGSSGYLEGLVSKYELQDTVQVMNSLPHKDISNYLYNTDVLFFIDAPFEPNPFLPTKLVEYIYTAKPILAITPDGASADVVRATKTGIVVSPNNIEGIRDAIEDYYHRYERAELEIEPDWNEIEKYSAERCTRTLVQIIEGLISPDNASKGAESLKS